MSLFDWFRGPDETLNTGKRADAVKHTRGADEIFREVVVLGHPDSDVVVTPAIAAPAAAEPAFPIRLGDGHDVAQGAKADAAAPTGDGSIIALLKAIRDALKPPSSATVTHPSVGGGSTQVFPANSARKRYMIVNEHPSQDMYIKEGVGASATSYTGVAQFGGGEYRSPFPAYTGVVEAIYSGGATLACAATEET